MFLLGRREVDVIEVGVLALDRSEGYRYVWNVQDRDAKGRFSKNAQGDDLELMVLGKRC